MNQSSIDRLRDYLAQLPPKAQALLMREFERAVERGDDDTVANLVLGELRKIVRSSSEDITPRSDDPMRLVFRPLDPFLINDGVPVGPGQIRRSSLGPAWLWLSREGATESIAGLTAALAQSADAATVEAAARAVQLAAAKAITEVSAAARDGERQRMLGRIGAPSVVEDIGAIGAVLQARDALDALSFRMPSRFGTFGENQIRTVLDGLNVPSLQNPQVLPFALVLVMNRLASPWQIVRLGITVAASDDELRVAGTPYGVTVTMAIHDLASVAAELRADIKRARFGETSHHLKTLHDGMRALRTELDLRPDSTWGRQLAAIRADISASLQSEIDNVPGRVRRLLRKGPDKEIAANSRIDPADVDEVVALIDFVATCRSYAGELAINEVTLRAYNELQQYVETATENLVEALRAGDPRVRAYRQMQMQAAIRFCDVLFGPDYASLMAKAADVARVGERKAPRAG